MTVVVTYQHKLIAVVAIDDTDEAWNNLLAFGKSIGKEHGANDKFRDIGEGYSNGPVKLMRIRPEVVVNG